MTRSAGRTGAGVDAADSAGAAAVAAIAAVADAGGVATVAAAAAEPGTVGVAVVTGAAGFVEVGASADPLAMAAFVAGSAAVALAPGLVDGASPATVDRGRGAA